MSPPSTQPSFSPELAFTGEKAVQGGAADLGALKDLGFAQARLQRFPRRVRDFLQRLPLSLAGATEVLSEVVEDSAELDVLGVGHSVSITRLREIGNRVTMLARQTGSRC